VITGGTEAGANHGHVNVEPHHPTTGEGRGSSGLGAATLAVWPACTLALPPNPATDTDPAPTVNVRPWPFAPVFMAKLVATPAVTTAWPTYAMSRAPFVTFALHDPRMTT
jgi:hypothetical protein